MLAKHPVPGAVKTRLAAGVGDATACALHRAFVLDLAARLRRARASVWWAFTPASAPFAALVASRRCFPQCRGDLGARLAHATARVLRAGRGPVIALGADAPHVPVRALRRAAVALERGADVVLGPARDGGYYLIGLARPRPAVFRGVRWSTGRVLAATRARCRRARLRVGEVEPTFDVDDVDDLRMLARLVARRRVRLPHTRRILRDLAMLG